MLNNPRMAQLHAQEAPDRVRELEAWGAVFDRTRDGRILQRPFGGHSHPRLAHVGDRTGLEMIRTLQDRAVAAGIDGLHGVHDHPPDRPAATASPGRSATGATTGEPVVFPAKATVLATGGIGRAYAVTSNSWEYSGDGQALAYRAGAELIDMEFVQFHPTGMVWPPGVRGLLVTEAVRGEGGILRNKDGERFMWDYLPEDRRDEYAATDEEAAQWVEALSAGPDDRRPPAAGALDPRQRRAGDLHRGPRGPRLAPRRRLPRHQLPAGRPRPAQAAVDVRAVQGAGRRRHHGGPDGGRPDDPLRDGRHPGRRGDRRHDRDGPVRRGRGRRRDARREPARRQLAVGPARVRAADRGRRGGRTRRAATTSRGCRPGRGPGGAGASSRRRSSGAATGESPYRAPRGPPGGDAAPGRHLPDRGGPRRGDRTSSTRSAPRWPNVRVSGGRAFNPGWNLVFEVRNMLVASEAVARSARQRDESRGAHSRLDFPEHRREVGQEEQRRPARRRRHGGRDDEAAQDARRAPQPAREGVEA